MPTEKNPKKPRVFIVDDHAVVREGLKHMLEGTGGFTVCGEGADAFETLESIQRTQAEIAIIDVGMKGMNGIELIKHLKQRMPGMSILVMSMFDEMTYAERAIRAGARGYIMKQESIENVVSALNQILSGKTYVSENLTTTLVENFAKTGKINASPFQSLSDRELEVFQLTGQGINKRKIADDLKLSVKTVDSYREQIKTKLNLSGNAELLEVAIKWVHSDQSE